MAFLQASPAAPARRRLGVVGPRDGGLAVLLPAVDDATAEAARGRVAAAAGACRRASGGCGARRATRALRTRRRGTP